MELEMNRVCSETNGQKELQEPFVKCRYVIVLVSFLLFFLVNAYRMNVSVGIVAMVNNSAVFHGTNATPDTCPDLISNATAEENFFEGEFSWSPDIQGYIQGSNFLAYMIALVPAGRLMERFGCKWFLFGCSLLTAVGTLLIPTLSWLSVSALVAVQAVRGLAQGFIHPALYTLVSNWLPKTERGFALSFMCSGLSMGSCLGSLFTGLLSASSGGWPSVFYAFGALGLLVSIAIALFIYESPKDHPRISEAEIHHILSNQERTLAKRRPEFPWRKILTCIPAYALIYGCFGQTWSISQFLIVQSTFFGTILHCTISENGFFTALGFALMFVFSQLSGWLSFYLLQKNMTSVNFSRKFWNSVACLGFSACQLAVYFARCNRSLSVIFGVLSLGFTGFSFSGCWVVPSDMTPTFAGSVNAMCVTVGCMSSVILPLLVGYLTNEVQSIEQWNKIFLIGIGVVMASGIVFAVFGSADTQPWNYVEDKSAEQKDGDKKTRF